MKPNWYWFFHQKIQAPVLSDSSQMYGSHRRNTHNNRGANSVQSWRFYFSLSLEELSAIHRFHSEQHWTELIMKILKFIGIPKSLHSKTARLAKFSTCQKKKKGVCNYFWLNFWLHISCSKYWISNQKTSFHLDLGNHSIRASGWRSFKIRVAD